MIKWRRALPKDAKALAEIDAVCLDHPWSENSFHGELDEPERKVYMVAVERDIIIGYGGLWIIGEEGHITNIAVLPSHRGQGIGTGILQRLMEQTRLVDYTLEVAASNETARSLYEKMGFRVRGRRPGYYGKEDAMIMWHQRK